MQDIIETARKQTYNQGYIPDEETKKELWKGVEKVKETNQNNETESSQTNTPEEQERTAQIAEYEFRKAGQQLFQQADSVAAQFEQYGYSLEDLFSEAIYWYKATISGRNNDEQEDNKESGNE